MMSSASIPGSIRTGTWKPSKTRRMTRDLGDEVGGHLGPVGLVVGEDLRAEHRARRRRRRRPGSRACGPASRLSMSRKMPKTAWVGCPAGPVISGIAWKTWKIREKASRM